MGDVDIYPKDLIEIKRWFELVHHNKTGIKPTEQAKRTMLKIQALINEDEDFEEFSKEH